MTRLYCNDTLGIAESNETERNLQSLLWLNPQHHEQEIQPIVSERLRMSNVKLTAQFLISAHTAHL